MNFKKFIPIVLLALPTLNACNDQDFDIQFKPYIDYAYVDEEYDFKAALVIDSGADYSLKVYYQDYYEGKEYELEVRDTFYFTPTTDFNLNVYVTAKKGNVTITKDKVIFVTFRADPIDELLATGGFGGYSDQGITKLLSNEEKCLYPGSDSKTALDIRYQGGLPYQYGCGLLCLNNFRFLDYWTDKTWDNAVLRFYVYNPTDYDFEFQLRLKDNFKTPLDCDWGESINTPRFAKPHQWTEILFSLKHYGITFPLFLNEEGTRDDEFTVKVKWGGASTDGTFYDYQLFVDEVDIVPYTEEEFPYLDTECKTSRETIEFGWENLPLDEGWSRANISYDSNVVLSTESKTSLSSIHLEFNDVKKDISENGYFVAFDLKKKYEDDLPSFRHGTLDLDVYYSNVEDKTIRLVTVAANEKGDWTQIAHVDFLPLEIKDGWHHLSIDFTEYEQFELHTNEVILGFSFPGVKDSNKNDAHIYLDNIDFRQNSGLPERPIPVKEDLNSGLENGEFDSGWNGSIYSITNEEFNNTASTPSNASLKLTFDKSRKFDGFYGVVLDIQADYPGEMIAFNNVVLSFDVKFVGFEDETIRIKAVGNPIDWSQGGITDGLSGTKLDSGWTHFEIDTSTVECFANISHLVRLCFVLNGVNDANYSSLTAYLDNVVLH